MSISSFSSDTIDINGNPMYYERRGHGSHVLLLIPGALGTGSLHFSEQHSGFDLARFTLISVDLVGTGKSRLGVRQWERHYWFDAECCHLLMNKLHINEYSIVGFSDGGRVGLIMGGLYPNEIRKIVAFGSSSYITPDEKTALKGIFDIKSWNSVNRNEMLKIYGDELQSLWSQFLEAYFSYTDIFKSDLCKIKCPVFILHGEYDTIVFVEHAHYFKENIPNVKVYIHPKGPHSFHITSSAVFNQKVQEFLNES